MLTHPALEQLQTLGLKGMADAYRNLAEQGQSEDLNREDWLALMLDREAAMRADKRLANRLRTAKLRFHDACIEDIDFASERGLDRRNILSLADGAWLKALEYPSPHRATPAYVVVISSDLDTSRNKVSVSGLSWISRKPIDSRTSGLPSITRGRSRMVQRPRPDLRGGCAAMRIPTATAGAWATSVPTAIRHGPPARRVAGRRIRC